MQAMINEGFQVLSVIVFHKLNINQEIHFGLTHPSFHATRVPDVADVKQ